MRPSALGADLRLREEIEFGSSSCEIGGELIGTQNVVDD